MLRLTASPPYKIAELLVSSPETPMPSKHKQRINPLSQSQRTKMAACEWYTCRAPELDALRAVAQRAVFEHNTMPRDERGDIGPALRALLRTIGAGARIEAPFHCAYGFNISLG